MSCDTKFMTINRKFICFLLIFVTQLVALPLDDTKYHWKIKQTQNWINGKWVELQNEERLFDNNGHLIEVTLRTLKDGEWINNRKEVIKYRPNESMCTTFFWSNGKWVDNYEQDRWTRRIIFNNHGDTISAEDKTIRKMMPPFLSLTKYEYSDNICDQKTQSKFANNDYVFSNRRLKKFNHNGLLEEEVLFKWQYNDWQKIWRKQLYYNELCSIADTCFNWKDNGWVISDDSPIHKYKCKEDGKIVNVIKYMKLGNEWIEFSKQDITYDIKNRLIMIIETDWYPALERWALTFKTIYTY